MAIKFSSCRIFLCVILVFLSAEISSSRRINGRNTGMGHMDPSVRVFFTTKDLKIGNKIPIYFRNKNNSNSPHLLPREKSNSIPFSSKNLKYLLELFDFPANSPQAKGVRYTLTQCETRPVPGETKTCATSLESMLDFARVTFGLDRQFKALTTNYATKPAKELQEYKIVKEPREIEAKKMVSCHIMPYPYVVYYCHGGEGRNRVYEMALRGGDGAEIAAAAICHMDTSRWDGNHPAFRVLKTKAGESPVCHFLPADNVVWVPVNGD